MFSQLDKVRIKLSTGGHSKDATGDIVAKILCIGSRHIDCVKCIGNGQDSRGEGNERTA
jgi:hypothetical protein